MHLYKQSATFRNTCRPKSRPLARAVPDAFSRGWALHWPIERDGARREKGGLSGRQPYTDIGSLLAQLVVY